MSCQQALVTIQTVSVAKSESYGIFGEPGGSAEWDLRFNVAGLGAAIRYDGVTDGAVLTVNQPFLVDLGPPECLLVQVSGKEIDDSSKNDGLPTAKLKITPATNWSEGQSFTFSAPSHDDFAYDVTCDIRCATTSVTGSVHDILPRQDGWRWCHRCMGLWFNGGGTRGACPTGGGHDLTGSGDYILLGA